MKRAAVSPAMLAWWGILAAVFALVLKLNLPGHLSVDSVISLAEGRSGYRITWGPPMYSAILGAFDRTSPGVSLYVVASLLLLLASWALLPTLRPRLSWTGPLVLVLAAATPQVAIYQGVVWKDVLFANLTVAAFTALALAGKSWDLPWRRVPMLAIASLLLAFACLVRQNGFVAVSVFAVALGWIALRDGRWTAAGWLAAGLAAPLALLVGLDAVTPVRERPGVADQDKGIRLVQQYDLAAALAENPARPLPELERVDPQAVAVLRREAPRVYSPTRVDTLDASKAYGDAVWNLPAAAVGAQWRDLILSDPLAYVERRLRVFRWVFASPVIDWCLPAYVGVDGPPAQMRALGLERRWDERDRRLFNYSTWFLDTPAMSHVAYAAIALAVGLLLLIRREPADLAMAGLMAAALAFAASFFVISLACDYRYLYFLDLAALSGLIYFALDPALKRRA